MFFCTRRETKLIMEGRSCGFVRRYSPPEGCPHKSNSQIVFTSKYLPWTPDDGKSIPFAKATVVSVRPGTVGSFRRDNRQAGDDGFANGEVWVGHLRQIRGYEDIDDAAPVYHVKFRIDEIDKKAGR